MGVTTGANFLEDAINSLSVALKNSPMNQGKKALAKAQAGAYDEAATRAKIEQYINTIRWWCSPGVAVPSARMPRHC